jgi:multidrug resistance protein, MATE family
MSAGARLLDLIGYDPALASQIGRFQHAVCWGAPGFLLFAVLRSLLSALERPRAVMIVLALCVPANAGLNWVLIFGHFGAPAFGFIGAAYASATVQWLMLLGAAASVWMLRRRGQAPRLRGERRDILSDFRRIARIGGPIAGMIALEIGVFTLSAAVVGLFGASALAAHQIAINYASITFMVPLGIAQAATVRVAAQRGAGRASGARRAAFVALAMGATFMAASALVIWTMPQTIVAAYVAVDDPANRELVALALRFLAFAAAFQIADGVQCVAAGGLRGYEDTTTPMLLAAIGYWGVGFAGGWALAFPFGLGPAGLWWGFVLGLATVALLLSARLWRQTRVSQKKCHSREIPGSSPGRNP